MLYGDHLALGLAIGLSRGPEPFFAVGDVVHDAGLSPDRDAVANLQMTGETDLSAENHVVAQFGAARDASLRHDDAMLTEGDVVGDLDQVIHLGALADNGRAERATVHGHICPQLDVVADDDVADLGHLAMDAVIQNVAEAIRADDRAGMDADAVADFSAGIERDVGKEVDVLAQQAIRANAVKGLQHGSRADPHPLAQDAIGPDVGRRVHLGAGWDDRRGVNAGGEGRLGEEQRQGFGKSNAGIGHADEGLAAGGDQSVNNDGGCGALLGPGEVIIVLGKSKVTRLGAVRGGETLKDERRVTEDFASKEPGNIGSGIRHRQLTWISAGTIKAAAANSTPTLNMSKTLRVGMIGYGFMGKAHSNAWREASCRFPLRAKLELHTLCGRSHAGVQAARAQLGWQYASTDWREVIESPLIEVVDITTPNDSHAEIAMAAARAGKHVLCEKPLALNVKEAGAMLEAAQKAKIVHMVCQHLRRVPALAQARRMIAEGAIGQVYHYHARYAQDWLVDPEVPLRWRLQKSICGSGAHGDINIHVIDLGRYLVGEFKEVCGLMHTFVKERPLLEEGGAVRDLPPKPARRKGKAGKPGAAQKVQEAAAKSTPKLGKVTVDDATLFIGQFENGALANLEATRYAPGRKSQMTIEINGSKGSLCFDFEDMNRLRYYDTASLPDRQGFRDILVLQAGGTHPYLGPWCRAGHLLGHEHSLVHTIADFVNACADGKPIQPTFEDGFKNQRVLHAVEESVKARGWVKV